MNAIAFDTLKFAKRLKEAGFTEQQAEALAIAEAELIDQNLTTKRDFKELDIKIETIRDELKRDIKEVEAALTRDIKALDVKIETIRDELKREIKGVEAALTRDIKALDVKIEQLRLEFKRDMNEMEHRMVIKLGGMLVIAIGLMATLVKLL